MIWQVHTGADDPGRIGDTSLYYGNDYLIAADGKESWLKVYGTDGTQDTPRKWEGFDKYKLTYMLRSTGLESLGNDTVVSLFSLFISSRKVVGSFLTAPSVSTIQSFPPLNVDC